MLAHLAADRALVVDLDAKILDLERSLFALRTEKQLARERLDSFKYPVLALPNEITAEIFIHFIPLYPDCPPFAGPHSPTLLTQICRKWREIAVGTPTLWRAILVPSPNNSSSSDRCVHLCEAWLNRSGCCPLSVHLPNEEDQVVLEILATLVPHRSRWEYLYLTLFASDVPAIEGPMPLLRRLDLSVPDELPAVVTFSPAPLLRSLTLRATTPLNVALPLGQVTSLTLDMVYRSEYAVILRQTRNLVHFELNAFFEWDATSDLPPDHDIELPCLESFALRNQDVPNTIAAAHLSDFRVPALRILRLDQSFLGLEPIDTLASFISKSGCTLQQVCFTRSDALLASYREAFPSIHFFNYGDHFDAASISAHSP
ncbi:hypothetical protein K438DRAFT_602902 [Mycena galopus ATCC 62051]|nr:hypothetical protein K438DRAFT_602902 [Mycena galopus ATCC 62051]